MKRAVVTLAVVFALSACGLIDPDVDDYRLQLPEKEFQVDSDEWNMTIAATTFPAVPCEVDCAVQATTWCPDGACAGECAGTSCAVTVPLSKYQSVDLETEMEELRQVDQGPGVRVRIENIEFIIDVNTLNVATPPLDVYMAPIDVLALPDAAAAKIGTVPAIPAGSRTTTNIEYVAGGQDAAEVYLSDYTTPFNLLVGGTARFEAGDLVPAGRMVGRVTGTVLADAL